MADRLSYFPKGYTDSRARFLDTAKALAGQKETGSWRVPSRTDADLTVDYVYLPPGLTHDKLFVVISGTHGPEGHLGSAAQHLFFTEILPKLKRENVGVLIVHALNAWGFKNMNRCTENGINLNRNCSIHPRLYESRNPAGLQMSRRFVRQKPVETLTSLLLENARIEGEHVHFTDDVSLDQFIKAVGPGQYEVPEALEFGGFGPEPQIKALSTKLAELIPRYRDIIELDLHTGLGQRGRLHLLTEGSGRTAHMGLFKELLDPDEDKAVYEYTMAETEGFYSVQGCTNFLFAEIGTKEQRVCALTMEFGTNGMSAKAQLEDYNYWMLDHEGAHYGYADDTIRKKVAAYRREAFGPAASEWRNTVLTACVGLFRAMFARAGILKS
jgi:hypothetical protein